tara:strand:- start:1256 stop:1705 length:450 start_codon:yes stop_codon:yes gene_type:complete
MAVIKPTLNLTANSSSATTDAGPLSIALSLSATDTLTVDTVESQTLVFTGAGDHQVLFDGSAKDDGGTAGTHGSFVYMKNATASDLDIYIGAVADGVSASDLAAADDAVRLFTLKQGEFAWMPYDYTMDIVCDAEGAATLEYWMFNRAI